MKTVSINKLFQIQQNIPNATICMSIIRGSLWGPATLPDINEEILIQFNVEEYLFREIDKKDELGIVLTSRLIDDKLNMIYWPSNVYKIYFNDQPMRIEHKYYEDIPLPFIMNLKEYCKVGQNTVKFVQLSKPLHPLAFHVFISHEPPLAKAISASFDNGYVNKNLIAMINLYCFQNKTNSIIISRLCPISFTPIKNAIRFKECSHIQPIDLESFLKLYSKWMIDFCPICNVPISFNSNQNNLVFDNSLSLLFNNHADINKDYLQLKNDGNCVWTTHNEFILQQQLQMSQRNSHRYGYPQIQSQLHHQIQPQLNSQMQPQHNSQMQPQLNSQMKPQPNSQMQPQRNVRMQPLLHRQMAPQMQTQLHSQMQFTPHPHMQFSPQTQPQRHPPLQYQVSVKKEPNLLPQVQNHKEMLPQFHSQIPQQVLPQMQSPIYSPNNAHTQSSINSQIKSPINARNQTPDHSMMQSNQILQTVLGSPVAIEQYKPHSIKTKSENLIFFDDDTNNDEILTATDGLDLIDEDERLFKLP